MQVIFIKDLKKQGNKGEIKSVKDGYAQNFLIKNGYAIPVNDKNLTELSNEKVREKNIDNKNKEQALKLKEKLEKESFEFKIKVGKNDRVFGSISTKQIKESLMEKGYQIDKKQIQMNNIISLGYHDVIINLYNSISANIKIHVVK